ncbi:methionine aminopeptidase, type II [Vavraia culicis subsp. floridensis]|uniref:Methionine aminopeptidase, type II n=1 Tax=Vavraia culicis (isolate floridensis) TaxID=948595 RepID=L2GXQ1_VAVCU|nr:methionine aminopeptidase, type II [Vavraia culicis subsp. floridensis]ELA48152.1 methionine aminopeptidase, type II [Vavraia culicis subsp. floridensis]
MSEKQKLSELPIELLEKVGHKPGEVIGKTLQTDVLANARRAAEAHRRVRYHLQNNLRPGMTLSEICSLVENSTTTLLKGELNDGLGFPTGVSLNDCAAHYSVNPGDEEIFLKETDVLKVDFGTHVNGVIMDSAFTVTWDPKMNKLLEASKEATEKGIKTMGVDVCVGEIGREISEVINSYELMLDGKRVPIKPVMNLNGHSIKPYKIHGGVSIPLVENDDPDRLEADGFYALETFATTGNGMVKDGPNCSHFMLTNPNKFMVSNPKNVKVLQIIKKHIKTLPFSARFIDRHYDFKTSSLISLKNLAMLGLLEPYPPLHDIKGSFVSQFEHTVYLNEETKEILTRGEDY